MNNANVAFTLHKQISGLDVDNHHVNLSKLPNHYVREQGWRRHGIQEKMGAKLRRNERHVQVQGERTISLPPCITLLRSRLLQMRRQWSSLPERNTSGHAGGNAAWEMMPDL